MIVADSPTRPRHYGVFGYLKARLAAPPSEPTPPDVAEDELVEPDVAEGKRAKPDEDELAESAPATPPADTPSAVPEHALVQRARHSRAAAGLPPPVDTKGMSPLAAAIVRAADQARGPGR